MTPLPHLPVQGLCWKLSRSWVVVFFFVCLFFKHVSLPGPETNLSLLQTRTFLYFGLTVHQAQRLCAVMVPHSSIHGEIPLDGWHIRFQLLPLALSDDNPVMIRMPNSWQVLQPLSSGPPGGLSLPVWQQRLNMAEGAHWQHCPELFILLRFQQLWKNKSNHLGTDSGHPDHLLWKEIQETEKLYKYFSWRKCHYLDSSSRQKK